MWFVLTTGGHESLQPACLPRSKAGVMVLLLAFSPVLVPRYTCKTLSATSMPLALGIATRATSSRRIEPSTVGPLVILLHFEVSPSVTVAPVGSKPLSWRRIRAKRRKRGGAEGRQPCAKREGSIRRVCVCAGGTQRAAGLMPSSAEDPRAAGAREVRAEAEARYRRGGGGGGDGERAEKKKAAPANEERGSLQGESP